MTYLVRAMKVLMDYDEITVTNLAMLSRINYQRCRELIRLLRSSGYLLEKSGGKRQFVGLTGPGREFGRKLLEVHDMYRGELRTGMFAHGS